MKGFTTIAHNLLIIW